ncbi:MAG: DUF427 domain-containing protein [Acidimicrobiia bacterium]|jgi:uncharacterized protein (DUF427 family)
MSRSKRYRASWNATVLAETDDVVVVEGNVYFPSDAIAAEHLRITNGRSLCFWKGLASYYDVVVGGTVNPGAAWYYPHPSPLARRVKGRVAFWQGVRVEGM